MIDIATLEKEVLSLDIKERGRLASVLLRSLDKDDDDLPLSQEEIEDLWLKESIRRDKEMDADSSIGIPMESVLREMRELLK